MQPTNWRLSICGSPNLKGVGRIIDIPP